MSKRILEERSGKLYKSITEAMSLTNSTLSDIKFSLRNSQEDRWGNIWRDKEEYNEYYKAFNEKWNARDRIEREFDKSAFRSLCLREYKITEPPYASCTDVTSRGVCDHFKFKPID